MSNIKVISIIFTLLLVACATPTHWEKRGATAQDFNIDLGQCNAQAFGNANATLMTAAIVQNQCLQGKGWYLVKDK